MAAGDRDKWNARYHAKCGPMSAPSRYLVSLDEILPRQGRALDVAGGSGRNAVWLAQRGLEVSVADISEVGLALADANARASGVLLHTIVSDLERSALPPGPWDVIVNINFLLRPLFPHFAGQLAPGGYLVFTQPTMSNLQRHTQPGSKFLLHDGELPGLIRNLCGPTLKIIDYQEGWSDSGRHEARLLAHRIPD